MTPGNALVLLVVGSGVWFWIDSLRARERAVGLCRDSCRARGVQLLDQTVAVFDVGLARTEAGRLCIRRRYRFEFTRDGAARDAGTVLMHGARLVSLEMPDDGGRLYEHGEF